MDWYKSNLFIQCCINYLDCFQHLLLTFDSLHIFCSENLRDLQRFLRRDHPQTRDVFKQLGKWNTMSQDLIPIIEHYRDEPETIINAGMYYVVCLYITKLNWVTSLVRLQFLPVPKPSIVVLILGLILHTNLSDSLEQLGLFLEMPAIFLRCVWEGFSVFKLLLLPGRTWVDFTES